MGFLFFQSYGEKDTPIVEEIARVHKADIKVVEKHYKEMLKKVEAETKDEAKE